MSKKKKLITCIFCSDANVESSGEDWMPLWVANKLAYFAEQRHPGRKPSYVEHKYSDVETFSSDMQDGQPGRDADEKPRDRGAKPKGVKIPDVCRTCNGGWMSRLETDVIPIMEGLMSGRPKTLDPYDQLIFAAWIIKTCLTYDASFSNRQIPNEIGTYRFYACGMPMIYDHVSIGHDPDFVSEGSRVERRTSLRAVRDTGETFITVEFGFQFEHLIVRAVINCFENPFEIRPGRELTLGSPYHIEIWPRRQRVRWPSEAALDPTSVTEESVADSTTESKIEPT